MQKLSTFLALSIATLLVGLFVTACVVYPVMPQEAVDARHAAQTAEWVPTVTMVPAEATATEVVVAATLEATPSADCLIKGNLNSRGERIYHVPGGSSYDRTIVDPEGGVEAYFCTEAEAEAAGFRKALR